MSNGDIKFSSSIDETRKRLNEGKSPRIEYSTSDSTIDSDSIPSPFTTCNVTWEWVIRIGLAALLGLSEFCLTPFERKIQRTEWPLYMNPYKKDTVSVTALFGFMVLIPIIGGCTGYFSARNRLRKKKIEVRKNSGRPSQFNNAFNLCDMNSFVYCDMVDMLLSFTLAILVTMTMGNFAKYWVGRPRPDYFDRCFNDITKDTDPNDPNITFNVNINNFSAVKKVLDQFYDGTSDFKCFKEDEASRHKILEEGRKSFPSGHSLSAGVVFWFTSLYIWGKLQAFAPHKRFQSWRFVIGLIPIIPLIYTLITRTSDYRHHWQDVCVGGLFGILGAWVCYRLYYPELSSSFCHYSYRQQYWLLDDEHTIQKTEDPVVRKQLSEMKRYFDEQGIRGGSFKIKTDTMKLSSRAHKISEDHVV